MSLSYTGSINTKPSTLKDANYDPTTGALFIVESTTPTVRKYNPTTLAFIASATCLGFPSGITLINSASSVICTSSGTTIDFVENATLYRTNVSTGGSSTFSTHGQQIAGDPNSGVAFSVCTTPGKLTKITSAQSVAAVNPVTIGGTSNSFISHCIILKTTGRWLVGGAMGHIYEIDSTGTVMDSLIVDINPQSGINNLTSFDQPIISSLSYDNNMLLVATENTVILYDYSTKTKLWQEAKRNSNTDGLLLGASASGETLYSHAFSTNTANNLVKEVDFTVSPLRVRDQFFTGALNPIVSIGIASGTNIGYALQQTTELVHILNVTPRASALRTVTVQVGGIDQKARLIWLDDSGGVGTAKRVLDTYMQSPATYRIPTGKTIMEIVKVGTGTSATWGFSRFST